MRMVSIHAPVRERPCEYVRNGAGRSFNSRSREGATILPCFCWSVRKVSIHAPVRERLHVLVVLPYPVGFQFTLP